MIKEIVKDPVFLSVKSNDADKSDVQVIKDLKDTLNAHKADCVGMAANMIGVNKKIIIVSMGFINVIMLNPEIISKNGVYQVQEGCLSLNGQRLATRYKEIEVKYLDENFKPQRNKYNGFIAQIIQHEIDHTNGILI